MIHKSWVVILVMVFLLASCALPVRRGGRVMAYEDRLRLASIYIQSERFERAIPLLEAAAAQEPGRPEAHSMLGEVLFLSGDLEGAARSLYLAVDAGGDDPLVLNNLAWIELQRGRAPEALGLIERALESNPVPLYPYLDTRARVLKVLGRNGEALQDALTARKIVPEHDTRMISQLEDLIRELEKEAPGPRSY
ncbi:MAG: tetratricopeptide repeat protein [Proteobacteria bacterium]|nr:tetratricopeptide repeat protein [Pseudomonadota bacterium]